MKRKEFFKNTIILTLASCLLRGIGMLFRIYISDILGSEGMGVYQLIFSVFLLASTVASAGLTLAVTRIVTEELISTGKKSIEKVCGLTFSTTFIFGGLIALALFFTSDIISLEFLKDARCAKSLQALSISLPFMAACASMRGYFMARRKVGLSSRSQIFEELVKLGVTFALCTLNKGASVAAMCVYIMLADSLSEIASFIYLLIGYFIDRKSLPVFSGKPTIKTAEILKRLLSIVVPVSLVRYVNSGLYTAENIIVPNEIEGFTLSRGTALSQWGQLKGMAIPLFMFPSSFLAAFSMLLVPEISEACAKRDTKLMQKIVLISMQLSVVSSVLVGALFSILSYEVGIAIYNNTEVGFYMLVLSPIMPFIYVENVADGILKGLNQQVSTLKFSIINGIIRIGLIIPIVPFMGMKGFLFVMIVSNIITSSLNVERLLKVCRLKMQWKNWLIKPIGSAVLSYVFARGIKLFLQSSGMGNWGVLIITGIGMSIIYMLCIFVCKGVTVSELKAIFPKQNKA